MRTEKNLSSDMVRRSSTELLSVLGANKKAWYAIDTSFQETKTTMVSVADEPSTLIFHDLDERKPEADCKSIEWLSIYVCELTAHNTQVRIGR